MSEPIISLENLSKSYSIYSKPTDLFLEAFTGRSRHDTFWALKNISLSINEGQRVGFIGPNGAGKSTLLKIITGNLTPTSGNLKINGKISAMLSLASSLNPEESGLSNIKFNLLLQGASRSEINNLTEEIIDFTELGDFIYRPVKTYSSGMNARLAFAIATSVEPEILIVDEVLGAGDGYFIGKATKRMIELCNKGKALLFVSHSTSAVQMLCDFVVWMENGSIRMMGPAEHVLKLYEEDYRRQEDLTTRSVNAAQSKIQTTIGRIEDFSSSEIYRLRIVPDNKNRSFNDTHYIKKIRISNALIGDIDVDLELSNTASDQLVALDFLGSEWGRLFSKNEYPCRTLAKRTGKNAGGQILMKIPGDAEGIADVKIMFESSSINKSEDLTIEFLDYSTGKWEPCNSIHRADLESGWHETSAIIALPILPEDSFKNSRAKILEGLSPDVEIVGVGVSVDDVLSHVVKEGQPFVIYVDIFARRVIPTADVGIKIVRSDGVYVFWQSSGLVGENLFDFEGKIRVKFLFDDNYFSAGDYSISATCANGWDLENNYPYSEVFDRKISAFQFSVSREFPVLDFGQLNMKVEVQYVKN